MPNFCPDDVSAGMLSFTARTGEKLLAFTHRSMSEAVVILDRFKYALRDGGGTIRQRFGAPSSAGVAPYHSFGISPTGPHPPPWTGGVHNVWHNPVSTTTELKGLETISLFVNSVSGATTSLAYEFALNLTAQKPGVTYDDTVFRTKNVVAACGYEAIAEGGARNIANGVFLTASGVNPASGGQFNVIDLKGGVKVLKYPMAAGAFGMTTLYDPFIRIVAAET